MNHHGAVTRVALGALTALVATLLVATAPASDAKPATGRLFVVQAVPGSTYTVEIDGAHRTAGVKVGTVLGPFEVSAGEHDVSFTGDSAGQATETTVKVRPGSSTDLVLHLPAAVNGDPVVDVYRAPLSPIGPDKARVLVAHTATVPPADAVVDGKVVFANIANGEYAVADVPAGAHTAKLVAAGTKGPALLGPLDLDLPAQTLTMIYAVGTPTNGSMNVITHQLSLASDGSVVPQRVDTGSAGLAARLRVTPFGHF